MALPPFTDSGDLPVGVHPATLREVVDRFGVGPAQRKVVATRLERICQVARSSGHLARLVVFGSFITDKPEPNDVDVFLLMEDTFDASQLTGEVQLLFDHAAAQAHFGASVFWLRRLAALEGEQAALEYWQVKRGGGLRGVVEIVPEAP
jgi:predicted nucleotidyltransferase